MVSIEQGEVACLDFWPPIKTDNEELMICKILRSVRTTRTFLWAVVQKPHCTRTQAIDVDENGRFDRSGLHAPAASHEKPEQKHDGHVMPCQAVPAMPCPADMCLDLRGRLPTWPSTWQPRYCEISFSVAGYYYYCYYYD